MSVIRLGTLLLALLTAWPFSTGCVTRGERAERVAVEMLNPRAGSREELRLRQRLINLTPESEAALDLAFFPIGLYDVPESALAEVGAAGFNLVLNGDTSENYLAHARAAGLRVIPYIHTDRRMASDVRAACGERTIYAWYLADEPDLNQMEPATYRDLSRKLRRLDPTRAIFLTVLSPKNYALYARFADVLAPNPYPIQRMDQGNDLRAVVRFVRAACEAARGRPVWVVLQAFWAEPIWPRNPTPAELRAMAFMALNHGATGLIYFSWKSGNRTLPEHRELFAAICALNEEVYAMRGALLVPPEEGAVEVTQVTEPQAVIRQRAVQSREEPILIDCSVRKIGDTRLLIAVNPDPWPKHATILCGGASIERRFEPFQVHVIRILRPTILPDGADIEP